MPAISALSFDGMRAALCNAEGAVRKTRSPGRPGPTIVRCALLAASGMIAAGCGSPVDLLTGGRVKGDAQSVTVVADSAPQAAPMALAHCSHYGLGTRFDGEVETGVYRYLCIARDGEQS